LAEFRALGTDPISFFCNVLPDEKAADDERMEAAAELLPYYHPRLAKMGLLLRRFLLRAPSVNGGPAETF
jgi:hypothetical protein